MWAIICIIIFAFFRIILILNEYYSKYKTLKTQNLIKNSNKKEQEQKINEQKELKPLICPRCYGIINLKTLTCEYCNTKFI